MKQHTAIRDTARAAMLEINVRAMSGNGSEGTASDGAGETQQVGYSSIDNRKSLTGKDIAK